MERRTAKRANGVNEASRILYARTDGLQVLKLIGEMRVLLAPTIAAFGERLKAEDEYRTLVIDLTDVTSIDSTNLGMLARLSARVHDIYGTLPTIVSGNDDVNRIMRAMGFDQIFVMVTGDAQPTCGYEQLPAVSVAEKELRAHVIECHRVLMGLSEANRTAFTDLVDALQGEHARSARG